MKKIIFVISLLAVSTGICGSDVVINKECPVQQADQPVGFFAGLQQVLQKEVVERRCVKVTGWGAEITYVEDRRNQTYGEQLLTCVSYMMRYAHQDSADADDQRK